MKYDGLRKAIKWLEKLKHNWIQFIKCYTIEKHRMYRGWTIGCTFAVVYLCLISFVISLLFLLIFKTDSDYAKGYGILAVLIIIALVFVGLLIVVIIEAILKLILKIIEKKNIK